MHCGTVALITPHTTSHRTAEETLALGYIGSVLREAGYTVLIVDGWLEHLSLAEIVRAVMTSGPPDVVALSCYRSNLAEAIEVIQALRLVVPDLPAIAGGYGPTFHAADFLAGGFDAVVQGEAEHIIEPLVRRLRQRQELTDVPGVAFLDPAGKLVEVRRAEPAADLDRLPWPARDTVDHAIAAHNFVHVCTSRGCGAYCWYCSIAAFTVGGSRSLRWRGRSVASIVAELAQLRHHYGISHFKFVDDSFIEPPRDLAWVRHLAETLGEAGLTDIRFRTQVRTDRLDPELVIALAGAGWFSTAAGVENAAPTALARMLKQADPVQNQEALDALEAVGVYVQMGMILFDPYTTWDELLINLAFLQRNTWPFTKGIFTEMFAATGTPFTRRLEAQGLITAGFSQNGGYEVQDPAVRRVYQLLKSWHSSHSRLYDWVIDVLTAPKVVPDDDFTAIHALCQRLQRLDVAFFAAVLGYVNAQPHSSDDAGFLEAHLTAASSEYLQIKELIGAIYARLGMSYDAVANPFLS